MRKLNLFFIAVLILLIVGCEYSFLDLMRVKSSSGVENIHYSGRFDLSIPSAPRFEWSGTSIGAHFKGTGVSMMLNSGGINYFEVLIDGTSVSPVVTSTGNETFILASGLTDTEHDVLVVRRTEATCLPVSFLGFTITGGSIIASASPWSHRIEYIGDSILTGYGILGPNELCTYSAATQSAWMTYAAVAGRDLKADTHLIAYASKGVYQNYNGNLTDPMPTLYTRTIPTESGSTWGFSSKADVVVIHLGLYDFTAAVNQVLFETAYINLINLVRSNHPSAVIYCVNGATFNATANTYISNSVTNSGDANTHLLTLPAPILPADGYGCDWHPSAVTHARWGGILAARLRTDLGW